MSKAWTKEMVALGFVSADDMLARIAELEAAVESIDGVCRRLMIEAASDQACVLAVGSALDKVRVETLKHKCQ